MREAYMLHAPVSETKNMTARSKAPSLFTPARKLQANFGAADSVGRHPRGAAQATFGNQAILRMLNSSTHSEGILQRKCACEASGADCASCNEKKESTLQRESGTHAEPNRVPRIVHEV